MTNAMLHNLETCSAPECLQVATIETRHGTTWCGYCARHSLRYHGQPQRPIPAA